MDYLVKGFIRPQYFDVKFGRKRCEWFEEVVKASSRDEARELARFRVQQSSLSLVTVESVEPLGGEEVKIASSSVHIPNLDLPWYENEITFFDTETTGLNPETDRIVEIGFTRYDREKRAFIESESYFINDGKEIPAEATNIHGITNEMIADAPTFAEVFEEVYPKLIRGRLFIGSHNRGFDIAHLLASMFRHDISAHIPPVLCTMEMALNNKDIRTRNHRLETLINYFNLDNVNSHRAGDDALSSGSVFLEMARMSGSPFRKKGATGRDIVEYIDSFSWSGDEQSRGVV